MSEGTRTPISVDWPPPCEAIVGGTGLASRPCRNPGWYRVVWSGAAKDLCKVHMKKAVKEYGDMVKVEAR